MRCTFTYFVDNKKKDKTDGVDVWSWLTASFWAKQNYIKSKMLVKASLNDKNVLVKISAVLLTEIVEWNYHHYKFVYSNQCVITKS